jgi:hypothetical protein
MRSSELDDRSTWHRKGDELFEVKIEVKRRRTADSCRADRSRADDHLRPRFHFIGTGLAVIDGSIDGWIEEPVT